MHLEISFIFDEICSKNNSLYDQKNTLKVSKRDLNLVLAVGFYKNLDGTLIKIGHR